MKPKKTPAETPAEFTGQQIQLLKSTICKGATDDELRLFMAQCRRTQLDPFARQIFAIKRWDSRERREIMATQISIDGARLVAERSGKYAGQTPPEWCGEDGKWVDVWLAEDPPAAARIGVLRSDFREPCYGVARYRSYAQVTKEGFPTSMWSRMPDVMLAKCAEMLALRKAFPQELSGLYSGDEEPQVPAPATATPAAPPAVATSAQPWDNFKGMIEAFATLRGQLRPEDDHVYREVLGEFQVIHSNQFPDYATARQAYLRLRDRIRALASPAAEQLGVDETDLPAQAPAAPAESPRFPGGNEEAR